MLIGTALGLSSCGADTSSSSESSTDSETPLIEPDGTAEENPAESTTPYPPVAGEEPTNSYTWHDDYLGIELHLNDSCWTRMDATRESEIKSRFLDQPNWASLFQIIAILECSERSSFLAISQYTGTNRWYADVEQRMVSLGQLYLDSDSKASSTAEVFRMHLQIPGFHWIQLIDEKTGIRTVQLDYLQQQSQSDWQWKAEADELMNQLRPVAYSNQP